MKLCHLLYGILFSSHFLIAQESTNDLKKIKDYCDLLKQVAALPIELQEHIGSYYYADLKKGKNYIPSINSIYQKKKLPNAQDIAQDATVSEKEKHKRIKYWQDLRKGNFIYYKGPQHKFLDFLDRKFRSSLSDWGTLYFKDIPLYTAPDTEFSRNNLESITDPNVDIVGPNKNGIIIESNSQHVHKIQKVNGFENVKIFLFKIFGKSYTQQTVIPRGEINNFYLKCLHPNKNKFIKHVSGFCFQECLYDEEKKEIIEEFKIDNQTFGNSQVMYDPLDLENDSLYCFSNPVWGIGLLKYTYIG